MIAYSKTGLYNLRIQNEAEDAFNKECINEAERSAIKMHYPLQFYIPNFFIRIGLFILTIIVAAFTLALLFLITFNSGGDSYPMELLFFFAAMSYGALEFFIRQKHHYRSGVDDALLWVTVVCFVLGLSLINNLPMLGWAVLLFLLTGYLSLRFADALITALSCLSWLGIIFYSYAEFGAIAKLTMPFVIMPAAAALYVFAHGMTKTTLSLHYEPCFLAMKVVALLSFYAGGNYFLVREVGSNMFALNLKEDQGIPFGWLFWALTVSVPLLYIYRGVQKKDAVFLRVGLMLIAVMIFTIRYYYNLMPLEIAMTIGGIALITIAYSLIRYLRMPRRGFTYKEEKDGTPFSKLQVEALVINQTFSTPQTSEGAGTRFGGGSGGGAGASGTY